MKTVTIEIPDWALERDIYIFAGLETFACIPYGKGELLIKTERCNYCGACCIDLPARVNPPIARDPNGDCIHLTAGPMFECKLGIARPWGCSVYDPHRGRVENADAICSIRYDRRKI